MSIEEYVERYEQRKKTLKELLEKIIQAYKIKYKDIVIEYKIDEEGMLIKNAQVLICAIKIEKASTETILALNHWLSKNGFTLIEVIDNVYFYFIRRVY
jgi:uncharacterized protein YggL (DUF469 family)